MKRTAVILSALLLCACGGSSSPTAPSQATLPSSNSGSGVPFTLVLQTQGNVTFRATLNGQTYTANGQFQQRLPTGIYRLSGTFTPSGQLAAEVMTVAFIIPLTSAASGGVLSGSVRSISGPAFIVSQCNASYAVFDGVRTPQNFEVQFEVTANANSACQF